MWVRKDRVEGRGTDRAWDLGVYALYAVYTRIPCGLRTVIVIPQVMDMYWIPDAGRTRAIHGAGDSKLDRAPPPPPCLATAFTPVKKRRGGDLSERRKYLAAWILIGKNSGYARWMPHSSILKIGR